MSFDGNSTPASALATSSLSSERASAGRALQMSSRRVYSLLRSGIRTGAISQDEQLVEESLIKSLATSRNAVREALHMLAAEGLILRRRRTGTAVLNGISQIDAFDIGDSTDVKITLLDRRVVPNSDYMSVRLDSDERELVMTESVISLDDEPIALSVEYVEPRLITRFPDWTNVTGLAVVEGVERVYGLCFGHIEMVVESSTVEYRTAKVLGVEPGSAALVRESVSFDADDVPRVLSFVTFRGDRVALTSARSRSELVIDA